MLRLFTPQDTMNHPNGNPIDDPIWSVPGFALWWGNAHRIQLDHPMGWCLGIPDEGWALDCLAESFLAGINPEQAVQGAIDEFDPTP